jgi:predicted MFS family arabinose efflux permease
VKAGKKAFPLAVYAMVIGAFAVGDDEFIVAGVIREIANALSVTAADAGTKEPVVGDPEAGVQG